MVENSNFRKKFGFFCHRFFHQLITNGLDHSITDEQYKRGKTRSNGENVVE